MAAPARTLLLLLLCLSAVTSVSAQTDDPTATGRGLLGVRVVVVSSGGVRITEVSAGSPAEEIGLRVGDIITEVNGQAVNSVADAAAAIEAQAGAQVWLTVQRDGQALGFSVILRALLEAQRATPRYRVVPKDRLGDENLESAYLGLSLRGALRGVEVLGIDVGSPAEVAGVQVGDVLSAIDTRRVRTFAQVQRELARYQPGDVVTLELWRRAQALSLDVTLSASSSLDTSGPSSGLLRAFDFSPADVTHDPQAQTLTINAIPEDSPLYVIGLRQGDRVTAVDGQPLSGEGVRTMGPLRDLFDGATLTVTRADVVLHIEADATALLAMTLSAMGRELLILLPRMDRFEVQILPGKPPTGRFPRQALPGAQR